MGTWGTNLYDDDMTCDVKDCYLDYLKKGLSNEEAYNKIIDEYKEYFGDIEEPLFWYALSDTQWMTGRLMPEVKQKALKWLEEDGGIELWGKSTTGVSGWKKTLEALKVKLEKPMPPEKKFKKPVVFDRNPWKVNDIYAYQFHGKKAQERNLFGKYILIQKISDEPWYGGLIHSRVQVFDRVFDELPTLDNINGVRLLPMVRPYLDEERTKRTTTVGQYMNTLLIYSKKSDYPEKHLTFIGNKIGPANKVCFAPFCWYWKNLDDNLSLFYLKWQHAEYATISDGIYDYIK